MTWVLAGIMVVYALGWILIKSGDDPEEHS